MWCVRSHLAVLPRKLTSVRGFVGTRLSSLSHPGHRSNTSKCLSTSRLLHTQSKSMGGQSLTQTLGRTTVSRGSISGSFYNVLGTRHCSSERIETSDGELVYSGPIASQVRGVKLFSVSSSLMAIGLQPFILSQVMSNPETPLPALVTSAFLAVFTVVTPIMLHVLTRQYVTELYWNKSADEFTAFTYNILTLKKAIRFSSNDVEVPEISGFLKSHVVNGRPIFMDSRCFTNQDAYVALMGYDKPLDWEIPVDHRENFRDSSEETDEVKSEGEKLSQKDK